jgi:CBS-domain-containing membrane protein
VMWEHDCGIVPVLDAEGKLVGVVTDRDICMAAFFHGARLSELPVREVMARDLHTLRPEASLHDALALMRRMQVRRVPVVDDAGALVGIFSLADLANPAATGREVRDDDLRAVIAAVSRSRRAADPEVLVVEVKPAPRGEPPAAERGRAKDRPARGKPKARPKARRR